MIIIILAAFFSVVFALLQPNIYKSSVLLSPIEEEENNLGALLGQYSGLANIAGISFPSIVNTTSQSELALEILRSRAFIKEFIDNHDILPYLFAVDYWDTHSREIVLDKRIFNPDSKERTNLK